MTVYRVPVTITGFIEVTRQFDDHNGPPLTSMISEVLMRIPLQHATINVGELEKK